MSKPVAHGPLFDGGPRGQGGERQLRNFNLHSSKPLLKRVASQQPL